MVSATDIARARRSILSSSHRDIGRTPSAAAGPHFAAARFVVMQFAYAAHAGKEMLQIVSPAEAPARLPPILHGLHVLLSGGSGRCALRSD